MMNPLIVIMRMMVLYGIFFCICIIYIHCLVCQQRLLMGFYMKLNIKISKMGILMPHLLIVDFKQFFGFLSGVVIK